ncbi:xanthine dehydrogenase family protein molybdopterin-binding subunit [Vulcanisaeta thermophila]|uniref:xanthine dehydrogenase family protein molybdopterin-binding subunit n=1 Tax=Vulcanisaeta thermophila TaxID=867917 RepID=UPI000853B61E|nr:xanthine dehydrogenase family protein molybdopterin-binding subunit [Vulcanisaeta thermophila]
MSVHYREGLRAVLGTGEYINDLPTPPGTLYMAIYRSPYAHARILKVDVSDVFNHGGIAYGPNELARVIPNPFPLAIDAPIKYYPFARDKARFVGEPIAVVLASDPYKAVDLLDYVQVDFEPLKPVVSIDDALRGDVLVHDELKSNVAMHRHMKFGPVDKVFSEAPVVVKREFYYQKHNAMPLETYGVIAHYSGGKLRIWANAQGPMLVAYFITRALGLPTSSLELYTPRDIGGSFGSKYSIYPYAVLAAAASILSGKPVKWVESRTEHLVGSNSGGARKGIVEVAAERDGTIRGLRYVFYEDVGAYPRSPDPGVLFRVHGNLNGAYDVRAIEADFYVVLTNKLPTGLNRAYGGPPFYYMLEVAVNELARELGIDPLELRIKNLIRDFPRKIGDEYFYETVTGGLYPRQDYERVVRAIEPEYRRWLEERKRNPYIGVGIAVLVEPSGTNLGYVDLAVEPGKRRYPHSGAGTYVTMSLDMNGYIYVFINGTNEGLGHETTVAEVVASEFGIDPSMVIVENRVDTTRTWALSDGSYSSRFAPIVLSAVILASRQLKEKLTRLAMAVLKAESVGYENGQFYDVKNPSRRVDLRRLASSVNWDPGSLPEGVDPSLTVTVFYQPPTVKAAEGDKINSSATYAIQAHLAVIELDPVTYDVRVRKYVIAHDSGRMFKREFVDGQLMGGLMHGLALTLYEELMYDEQGNPMTTTLDIYESPTLAEAVGMNVEFIHFETPTKHLVSGAHGVGEGAMMGVPAAIVNALTSILGKPITDLPIRPHKIAKALEG